MQASHPPLQTHLKHKENEQNKETKDTRKTANSYAILAKQISSTKEQRLQPHILEASPLWHSCPPMQTSIHCTLLH